MAKGSRPTGAKRPATYTFAIDGYREAVRV
jgi:hypothetical protein